MHLRELKKQDAPFMLEWMHDPSVVKDLKANFANMTIDDCERFISLSKDNSKNLHMAIVDDNDEYLGTVSLKNINNGAAEFAITIRKSAMGKGIASKAMSEIIKLGFEKLGLKTIFWCVSPANQRAVKFYNKNGYQLVDKKGTQVEGYTKEQVDSYYWYAVE